MDAGPLRQSCGPFVAIANALRALGLQTPHIFNHDETQGLLLMTDFGNTTLLNKLDAQNAAFFYHRAIHILTALHRCQEMLGQQVPYFGRGLMWQEWSWHKEWVLHKWLGLVMPEDRESELDACYALLVDAADNQPHVFMHRDFHSANLMVLPNQDLGLLDFQDAFIGPVTYDAVSLLRDSYIKWPEEEVQAFAAACWASFVRSGALGNMGLYDFMRSFDWMGIQRHLKAMLTFARKHVRDQCPRYLHSVPRTLDYVLEASKSYAELAPLHCYYSEVVLPAVQKALS